MLPAALVEIRVRFFFFPSLSSLTAQSPRHLHMTAINKINPLLHVAARIT